MCGRLHCSPRQHAKRAQDPFAHMPLQLKELRDEESEAQRELAFAEAAVQELGPDNADVSAEGPEESEVEDEGGEENEQQDFGCRMAALEACASREAGEEMTLMTE